MELSELQDRWIDTNRKLELSIKLNRETLKKVITSHSRNCLYRIKTEALVSLLLPWIIVLLVVLGKLNISFVHQEHIPTLVTGIVLFTITFLTNYCFLIIYYYFLTKIDFTGGILEIKHRILKAEKIKHQQTILSYSMMPFAIAGIFMILGMPVFSMKKGLPLTAYLPLLLIIIVFLASLVVNIKYILSARFKNLKLEIAELEKLLNDEI